MSIHISASSIIL